MTEEKIIDIATKKAIENVFEVLKKNGFEIKESKTTFQKTEQLLYLIPQLKDAIKHNKDKISDLRKYGINKKGSAVHSISSNNPIKREESEIVEQEINKLLQRNYIILSQLKWVNGILDTLKKDKFYELISMKYYEDKTYDEMAEYFKCDSRTIGRNKNKLINRIRVLLFPNDSIDEVGH